VEIVNYDTYDRAPVMFDVMGFGKPVDDIAMLLQPGVLSVAWGSVVRQLAAALRFEVRGMKDGKVAVVLEHVTRLRDDLCQDWPQPAPDGGLIRIEVTGEASYAVDLCLSSPDGDHNHAGLVATGARVVNAIPAVVRAAPGIRTTLDLPLITGKGLYAS
jgi:2,4-diaminopentanoate dehydrogenase